MQNIKLTSEKIRIGCLTLINPKYPLKNEPDELEKVSAVFPDILLTPEANRALRSVLEKIGAGNGIVPVSGYRSFEEQAEIYNSSLNENGVEYTKSFVALPGASEHQSGLAIDLALNEGEIDFICPRFPRYGICERFRETAPDCGFIERYKSEKRAITKIAGEEWHFRYVGQPHSNIITEKDLCLEEYIEYLKQFTYPRNPLKWGKYRVFYIPSDCGEIQTDCIDKYTVSGNNVDGFVLTYMEE